MNNKLKQQNREQKKSFAFFPTLKTKNFKLKIAHFDDSRKGFVILIAVLVSGLLISLGAFIASIAVKELTLSSSGRDSQFAFYAADSAMECALYQDLHVFTYATSTVSTPAVSTRVTTCNGSSSSVTISATTGSTATSEFKVEFTEEGSSDGENAPYAIVTITKTDIGGPGDETIIWARGYNIKSTASPRRVERALQVTY